MRLFGNEAARGFLRVSISVGEQDFTVFKAIHNRLIFRGDRVKSKFRLNPCPTLVICWSSSSFLFTIRIKKINFCCFIVTMLMNWSVGTAEKYKVYFFNRCFQINQVRVHINHNLIRKGELITDISNAHKVICSKKVVTIVDGSPSKLNDRLG